MAIIAFAGAVMGYFHNRFWYGRDDGYYSYIALRLVHGAILHKDVQAFHGGYHYFINMAAMQAFGERMISLRYPLIALGVAQSLLVFIMVQNRGIWTAIAAACAIALFGIVQFFSTTPHWFCEFFFFLAVAYLSFTSPETRFRYVVLGGLLATIFLFRQLTGIFVAMGVLSFVLCEAQPSTSDGRPIVARATILLMAFSLIGYLVSKPDALNWTLFGIWPLLLMGWAAAKTRTNNGAVVRLASQLAAGAVCALIPLILYHLAHGSLSDWIKDTVIDAIAFSNMAYQDRPLYGALAVGAVERAWRMGTLAAIGNGAYWTLILMLPAVLAALYFPSLVKSDGRGDSLRVLPFMSLFYALVAVLYQHPTYLYFALGPVIVSIVSICGQFGRAVKVPVLAVIVAFCTAAAYFHGGQPASRSILDTMESRRTPHGRSQDPALADFFMSQSDQQTYERLLHLIRWHSKPGDPILAFPSQAELYVLTGRKNPLRYVFVPFGIRDGKTAEAAIVALLADPPQMIFAVPGLPYNSEFSNSVLAALMKDYRLIERVREFDVYAHI